MADQPAPARVVPWCLTDRSPPRPGAPHPRDHAPPAGCRSPSTPSTQARRALSRRRELVGVQHVLGEGVPRQAQRRPRRPRSSRGKLAAPVPSSKKNRRNTASLTCRCRARDSRSPLPAPAASCEFVPSHAGNGPAIDRREPIPAVLWRTVRDKVVTTIEEAVGNALASPTAPAGSHSSCDGPPLAVAPSRARGGG